MSQPPLEFSMEGYCVY